MNATQLRAQTHTSNPSAFQRCGVSAFWRFDVPLFPRFCVSAFRLFLVLTLAVQLTGCAGGDPINRWQSQLADYIKHEHNGDINGMRHYAEPAHQRTFSMLGASEGGVGLVAPQRADTIGVMLGQRVINDTRWHIFLVGVIRYKGSFAWMPLDDSTVEDIRLAACNVDSDGHYTWRVTEPDEAQLKRYISPQLAQWSQRYATEQDAPGPARTTFPWEGDDFHIEVDEQAQTITAHESTSGATWTLNLVESDQKKTNTQAR